MKRSENIIFQMILHGNSRVCATTETVYNSAIFAQGTDSVAGYSQQIGSTTFQDVSRLWDFEMCRALVDFAIFLKGGKGMCGRFKTLELCAILEFEAASVRSHS